MHVVVESIRLFTEKGYESTPVDEIASAAGVSRRTLFRQFRSKEDLIFADHETLLELVAERLADPASSTAAEDPWWAVCEAAELVFAHYATIRDVAVQRYRVVSQVPALRDRELVTTYRYQRLFEDFLRRARPAVPRVRIIAYAAAVTGAHNYLLRSMVRGDDGATAEALHRELRAIRGTVDGFVDGDRGDDHGDDREAEHDDDRQVALLTFPSGSTPDEIADEVRRRLTRHSVP